jgi:hypothetical protein
MSNRSLGTWLALVVGLTLALTVIPAFGESHVRIVRLSEVQGTVEVDRGTGQGFEKAALNMPMTEGMKLAAKADGRAEVEFEDGSTVRITPGTRIDFSQLALEDSGTRVSTLALMQGMAYVDYTGKGKTDAFTFQFKDEKVRPEQAAHFRVNLQEASAVLAVLNGELKVDGPSGQVEVAKNKSVSFDLANDNKYTLAKNVEEMPFDAWDKQQTKYQQAYASRGSYNNYPYGYGVSDLNYYGSYSNVPGYGTMWQPYFAGAGWSPFADGSWMFYPGLGYTWVSAYPWGWMPYRYGNWAFVPGYGWGWSPGFVGGWYPVVPVTNAPQRFKPPVAPATGTATVTVGHPVLTSGVPNRVVVQNGMAGMGVPRGAVNNLGKVSNQVQQNGRATVHTSSAVRASSMSSPSFGASGAGRMSTGTGHMGTGTAHTSTGHASSGGHTSAPSRH